MKLGFNFHGVWYARKPTGLTEEEDRLIRKHDAELRELCRWSPLEANALISDALIYMSQKARTPDVFQKTHERYQKKLDLLVRNQDMAALREEVRWMVREAISGRKLKRS